MLAAPAPQDAMLSYDSIRKMSKDALIQRIFLAPDPLVRDHRLSIADSDNRLTFNVQFAYAQAPAKAPGVCEVTVRTAYFESLVGGFTAYKPEPGYSAPVRLDLLTQDRRFAVNAEALKSRRELSPLECAAFGSPLSYRDNDEETAYFISEHGTGVSVAFGLNALDRAAQAIREAKIKAQCKYLWEEDQNAWLCGDPARTIASLDLSTLRFLSVGYCDPDPGVCIIGYFGLPKRKFLREQLTVSIRISGVDSPYGDIDEGEVAAVTLSGSPRIH